MDSFVYRVSHDLKVPAVNMSSLTNLLERKINKEEKLLTAIVEKMKESARNLQQTIFDLLEVSRIEKIPSSKKRN